MEPIFNGWVVRRSSGGLWELLVQNASAGFGGGSGLAGGTAKPNETLDQCVERSLAQTIPGATILSIDELASDVSEADVQIGWDATRIVDLLIHVESATPTQWHQVITDPQLADMSMEVDWEWTDLRQPIKLSGSDAGKTMAEVRRRLSSPGPAPSLILRWRPNPAIHAEPRDIGKALLAGNAHAAILPFHVHPLPSGWENVLPPYEIVRAAGHEVGLIFRISAETSMPELDRDWAMARWHAEPLATYDPQRDQFYEPGWQIWRSSPAELGDGPNILFEMTRELMADLMRAWKRPLKAWLNNMPNSDQTSIRLLAPSVISDQTIIVDGGVDDDLLSKFEDACTTPYLMSPELPRTVKQLGWVLVFYDRESKRCALLAAPDYAWFMEAMQGSCRLRHHAFEVLLRRGDELIAAVGE